MPREGRKLHSELGLQGGLRRRMLSKILIKARAEFRYSLLDIFVEGRDNRANVFPAGGLVMRIEVRPNHGARFDFAEFQFHGDPAKERASRDFLEVIEMSVQKKVSANIASQSVDAVVPA